MGTNYQPSKIEVYDRVYDWVYRSYRSRSLITMNYHITPDSMNKALHSCRKCPNNSRGFNIFNSNSCGRLSGAKFQPHLPTPGLSTRADAGAASDVIGLQPMAIHPRQHIQGSSPLPRRAASANHRVEACAKPRSQAMHLAYQTTPNWNTCTPTLLKRNTCDSIHGIQYTVCTRHVKVLGETWDMRTWIESTWVP